MSVILIDSEEQSLQVNAWNWGVLHYTLICSEPKLFEDEQLLERLRFGGAELGESEVMEIRSYLRDVVLPLIKPGEGMLPDFTVTRESGDGTLYRKELEKNYSLHYDVLVAVIAFLDAAKAPVRLL